MPYVLKDEKVSTFASSKCLLVKLLKIISNSGDVISIEDKILNGFE